MLTAAYYPLPPLQAPASQFFDIQIDGGQFKGVWEARTTMGGAMMEQVGGSAWRAGALATYTGPPGLMTAAYYPLPPKVEEKVRHYKDDLFTLPGSFDDGKPLAHDVTKEYVNPFRMPEPEHLDHPSWRRPPVKLSPAAKVSPPSSERTSAAGSPQSFITPPESPDAVEADAKEEEAAQGGVDQEQLINADLVCKEPLPVPDALPREQSGWVLADVVADIIYKHFSRRFGVIGAPRTVSEVKLREPSAEAMDARRAQVKKSEFAKLVKVTLERTCVTVEAVTAAVAIMTDERLRRELSARPLGLSLIGALAVANKLTTDFNFSARSWAIVSEYDVADINLAERGILHSFAYETSLKREALIHATHALMGSPAIDITAYLFLAYHLASIDH